MALATKEKGDVTTSSPSPTPTARSARCSPAVPLETALAWATPSRAANASSKAGTRGPSESWPDRRTSSTACSSASPEHGPRERHLLLADAAHGAGAGRPGSRTGGAAPAAGCSA